MKKIKDLFTQTKLKNLKGFLVVASLFLLCDKSKACPINATFNYTVGANGVVNFASTSTGTSSSSTYQWYFLPGTATGQTAVHTFTNGTFPVFLYVYDTSCFDSTVVYITVNTSTCNLNANFTYTVGANNTVNFTSISTGTTSGTTYQWYFNPGTATGATASHSFTANGNQQVTLVAQTGTCTDSVTYYISVCNLTTNFTYTIGANGFVNFTSTSTNTTANTTYQWYFFPGNSTTSTVTHQFTNGTHAVMLFMYDGNCVDSAYTYVTVATNTCNLIANFTQTVGANNSVAFTSTSTGTTASTTYQWKFYPGTATGSSVTHTFATNGYHQVTLYIQSGTCIDSVTYNISVCNLNANFIYTVSPSNVVSFTSTSTGTTASTSYNWYFLPGSATGATTTHSYASSGVYQVHFFIFDGSCSDSSAIIVNVNTPTCNLHANFNYTVNSNGSISFTNTSTGTSPSTTYLWSFGDSQQGSGATVTHTYSSTGQYSVMLHVYDSLCFDSTTIIVNVTSALGIKNNSNVLKSFKVHPNPNSGEFIISLNNAEASSNGIEVLIYNTLGQVVFKNNYENLNVGLNQKIKVEGLSEGAYLLKLNTGVQTHTTKMIIQN